MKIAVFSAQPYDRQFLDAANAAEGHELHYFDAALGPESVGPAAGYQAVCIFVNDVANAGVLEALKAGGTGLVALRCTGFNNVDLAAAARIGIKVVRVVSYSPNSVAEHAVALLLAVNRKVHRAYNRTRDSNFALDGLMGFDLYGKTAAVVVPARSAASLLGSWWASDATLSDTTLFQARSSRRLAHGMWAPAKSVRTRTSFPCTVRCHRRTITS